jgi:FKBP-type peptidyl-prolyl cis-trans isomerase SlpA
MSNELNISSNTKVSLNFSITLETGDVVDSNFDRAPVSFVMGDGSLLPGFEACLLGLKQGDEAAFTISLKMVSVSRKRLTIRIFRAIPSATTPI